MSEDPKPEAHPVLSATTLTALIAATALEWYWVWGVLFLYGTAVAVHSGVTFLISPVTRADHPLLFWSICAMWAGFALWYIADAF